MKSLLDRLKLKYWEPITYPPIGAYIAVLPKESFGTVYKVTRLDGEMIFAIPICHNGRRYEFDALEEDLSDPICYLIDPEDLPSCIE